MDGSSPAVSLNQPFSRYSVAMTTGTEQKLKAHLIRNDRQEDLCLSIYQSSSGAARLTALLTNVVLPQEGETEVHGNVSFTGDYVLRVAALASAEGGGVAILHSHPGGTGWQEMSGPDREAEASYANLVREITGLPLVGMTLAGGDSTWSARFWIKGKDPEVSAAGCENVRTIGECLGTSWNPRVLPAPTASRTLQRTVSCWGPRIQANMSRLRVLIVGAGTLGQDVALRLAMTGFHRLGFLDYDSLELVNLDRSISGTLLDVWLGRSKVEVVTRLTRLKATAEEFDPEPIEGSICEAEVVKRALDYDLIFCCIDDHPWPRSILNTLAYADLIPVIDGGLGIDSFPDGDGMRNATWRSHVLRPGRPCMACNGQLDLGKITMDKEGLLKDEEYIAGLPDSEKPQNENVATLAISAAGSLLAQFVSYVVAPAGLGDPGPLRYSLSTHCLEHIRINKNENCPIENDLLIGDRRQILTASDSVARQTIQERDSYRQRWPLRFLRFADDVMQWISFRMRETAKGRVARHVQLRLDNRKRRGQRMEGIESRSSAHRIQQCTKEKYHEKTESA